jgi:PAS domain S-box-containing protein
MANKQLIERLFQAVTGAHLVLKPDSGLTIVAASSEYLAATHTGAQIIGQPLFSIFPDSMASGDTRQTDEFRASLARVISGRVPDRLEAQRYDLYRSTADGGGFEERYWNILNTPILGEEGEVAFIVNYVEDASAKHNQDAVKILESITEGFFTLDRSWRFDYVNQEAHRILDKVPGALAGRVLWEVYPGLGGTEFEQAYHKAMYAREKGSFVGFYPNQQRWYDVTTSPAPEGISVYFRDVTAQKQVEQEKDRLRQDSETQQRMYETALNSTPDFLYVFDLNHRALYANEALRQTWGVDDVQGKHWMELGYEQWHADMHDAELDRVIATKAPIRGEIPFTGTNGTRTYDYIFAPVFDAAGAVVAVAGTTRDVTERQAAAQALRQQAEALAEAAQSKDEFLATLSHELRNPLAPLRTAIEILRRRGDVDDQSKRLYGLMDRQINHMVRLVEDLLEMSRISRGTLSLQKAPVDMAAVVSNALEIVEPLVKAAKHELIIELPEEPLPLEGDKVRLSQILSNLLSNAARYTNDGGRIVVSVQRDAAFAVVKVQDTGIGISDELLPRLFKMFSRGDRYSARHQGGLGIGLAIAQRLAEMHDGSLSVHSEGPGRGSEFVLRVPLAEAQTANSTAEAVEVARLTGSLNVLVVDDNRDAADALMIGLEALGANVKAVYGGPEALELLAEWRPAAVLLDIGMPGMNGYEVAESIRSLFETDRPLVIALTGWGQDEDRERAREAGFTHHLVKPVQLSAIRPLLESLLS